MTKTLKRVIALLSVSMFMALFSLSCFAQENSSAKKIYTEDLGDGITAVVTLSETNGMARSSKTYNVRKEYYKDRCCLGLPTKSKETKKNYLKTLIYNFFRPVRLVQRC